MNRVGFLYEKIYDINNIKLAIKNASRRKKDRRYVKRVLKNEDFFAREISEMLRKGEFVPGKNRVKIIKENGSSKKERVITVPRFYPDQIVHWAVMQVLAPVFKKGMYRYSCGSIPGRGGIDAKKFVSRTLKRGKNTKYVMKLDISKFFQSVDHDKMKEILARKIKDKKVLKLMGDIIDGGGEGLPIGYYTSQWLSNLYLDSVDHFLKEKEKAQNYVRYVDDMVFFGSNKRGLRKTLYSLKTFLEEKGYAVRIKKNWQIWKRDSRPLDFVGFVWKDGITRLRKQIFTGLIKCVNGIKRFGINILRARRYFSLIGWAKHADFRGVYLSTIKPAVSQRAVRIYLIKAESKLSASVA